MAVSYGGAGRLAVENGVARPGQSVDGGRTVDPSASAADPMFWWAGLREPALSQAACEAALDDGDGRLRRRLNRLGIAHCH